MSLSLGIVGLPNAGKSTLFNALTRSHQADAQNNPFCTIEPNVGIVEVPDERLGQLAAISHSKKVVPATIKFVDIAGLVKGASEGEGLGNKFLSHIREVDAICQVVRAFTDPNVTHVHNKVEPKEDAEVINLELILADLQTVSKRLVNAQGKAKGKVEKDVEIEIKLLGKLYLQLEAGKAARELEFTDDEIGMVKDLQLLTMKPMMCVMNIGEIEKLGNEEIKGWLGDVPHVLVCAKLEAELADIPPDEAKEYLKEMGMDRSGLDKIIVAGYQLLHLVTYLTSGEPETRAWTVKEGTLAPDAAGVIHTDFVKGFIKADVTPWQDFVAHNGWHGVKESGKLQLVGKEYVIQDGDVCYFHVST